MFSQVHILQLLWSPSNDLNNVVFQEQENREMLERFRMAHGESEDRELKLQHAEGLNNSIRLELLSSDTERRHLRETVGHQEREIQEVRLGGGGNVGGEKCCR